MEITEIKSLQRELNLELATYLYERLEKFRKQTGVSVDDVNVRFINVNSVGDITPQFIVGAVVTRLAIEY